MGWLVKTIDFNVRGWFFFQKRIDYTILIYHRKSIIFLCNQTMKDSKQIFTLQRILIRSKLFKRCKFEF